MQFTLENAKLVMEGKKTQTRRIVKDGDGADCYATGEIIQVCNRNNRVRWCVGDKVAVQPGRGKKSLGRIRITAIRRERVQDISNEDASAELGFGRGTLGDAMSYQLFAELWDSIYAGQPGKQWVDNPEVWALTFEVVK